MRIAPIPRPMLALFALLVAAAIWRAVSSIRLDQLLASAASLAPLALGALAIASALATQRFIATRRTLALATAVAVVPADEFDAEARGGPALRRRSWRAAIAACAAGSTAAPARCGCG